MATAVNFTKAWIAKLPPAPLKERAEYMDTTVIGLRLRVNDKGLKTYSVLGRLKGGPMERPTIGSTEDFTVSQARAEAKNILAKLARGESVKAAGRAKRGEISIGELVKTYLDRRTMKPRSRQEYQDLLRRHIEPVLGKVKLSDVTKDKVSRLHAAITRKAGRPGKDGKPVKVGAPVSANRCLGLLKAAFNWARDEAGIWAGENPTDGIKKNLEVSRERYVLSGEAQRLFEAIDQAPERARDFFLLALFTGARRRNVSAMRWIDLDLEAGVWRVPDTKNSAPLTIPLVGASLDILKARLADAKPAAVWVFPGIGKSGHYEESKNAWRTVLKRAGLVDLHIHDLRRTFGSWLASTGASMTIGAKAMGHKSLVAAAIYQRIAEADPIRAAVAKSTDALLMAAGRPTKPIAVPEDATAEVSSKADEFRNAPQAQHGHA
jgi:integrase